jgi:hypothetical protein
MYVERKNQTRRKNYDSEDDGGHNGSSNSALYMPQA